MKRYERSLDNGNMSRLTKGRLLLGAALLVSALIYARTLRFDFVYDDWEQIVRNPHLASAAYIPLYFTADVWSQSHSAGQGDYYRPIYLLFMLLNHSLFGISPAGWHAMSVLLELAAIFLVYLVGSELLRDPLGGGIAALLFGLHPVNIESVAWVSCSSELLMGIFLLIAFLLYLRFRSGGHAAYLVGSVLFFVLALGCKETAIAFVAILLWQEWYGPQLTNPSGKDTVTGVFRTKPVIFLSPYIFAMLSYLVVRNAVLAHVLGSTHYISQRVAILTAPPALAFYLRHLVLPIGLSLTYDLPYVDKVFSARFLLTSLIGVGTASLAWIFTRKNSAERTAIGWILIFLLLPLASIAEFPTGDVVHDRYLYVPTMGFAILVAAFLTRTKEKRSTQRAEVVLAAAAGAFAVMLAAQLGYWTNNPALFERAVHESPRGVLALDLLAHERLKEKDFTGAVSAYQRSLSVDPNSWRTNIALAITLSIMNENRQAIPYYQKAIQIEPKRVHEYIMLAHAQEREQLYADAEQTVDQGLLIANNLPELHFELGSLLERRGDLTAAEMHYQRALSIDPGLRDPTKHGDSAALTESIP